MKLKNICIFTILFIILFCNLSTNKSYATTKFTDEDLIEDTYKIDIYVISNLAYKEVDSNLIIPDEYQQKYQIKINNKPIESTQLYYQNGAIYNDAIIDEDGYFVPKVNSNNTYSMYKDYKDCYFIYDGDQYRISYLLKDYTEIYVDNKLQEWIDTNNIKNISDKVQRAREVTKYAGLNYTYTTEHTGLVERYLYGGGECWSASYMVYELAEKAGLDCEVRWAKNDSVSQLSTNHMNNVFYIDGKLYKADASLNKNYSFTQMPSQYTYFESAGDVIELRQYDGDDLEIEIPSTINSSTVTTIGEGFYAYSTFKPKKVIIPNTVTTLKKNAFYGSSYLEYLYIPASVTTIEGNALKVGKNCEIIIDKNNDNFLIKDNILYNKDMTTLIQPLSSYDSKTLVIPNTVTTIANGAFYQSGIQYITIPESVTTIGEQAFYNSGIRGITLPKSIKNIGKSAFESCVTLYSVDIEDGANFDIPEKCFYNQNGLNEFYIPSSITNIANNAFDAIARSVVFIGKANSTAEKFVNNKISEGKNFTFIAGKKQILSNIAKIEYSPDTNSSQYYYTGENIRPGVIVRFGDKVLKENVDYTLTYPSESYKIGYYQVKVTGINDYDGEYNINYSIIGYPSIATAECKKEAYLNENWDPIINNPENQDYYIMYKYPSDNYGSSVSTKPKEAGKYYICINFKKSDKYEAKTITKKIILKDPITWTISFDANSGSGTMESIQVYDGDDFTFPANKFTAPKGKSFDGWKIEDDGTYQPGDVKENISSNFTIKANWVDEPTYYTISFETNGGTAVKSQQIIEGNYATMPSTTKNGYVFKGWYKDAEFNEEFDFESNLITSDTTIYAKWDKIEHTHIWNTGVITTAQTCTEKGIKTYTCTSCNETKTEEIEALGHEWDKGNVVKEATCNSTGTKEYHCLHLCGKTKTETIPAKGHTAGITTYTNKVKEKAKLTENGVITTTTTTKCKICEEVISKKINNAPIYYPKTIELKTTSYIYDGKEKKPAVVVTDSNGKIIDKSNYIVEYSSNKKVGTGIATITFKGNYEGIKKLSFIINPKGTSLKKLKAGKKRIRVTWNKQKKETSGYQIQYSTKKKFKSGNKTSKVKKNKITSSTIKKLKAKKKYYVRIRTYKKVNGKTYYSGWSKVRNITTKK